MSDETMNNVIEKLLSQGMGAYSIVFQGGEPTLCGIDYFRRFVEKVNKTLGVGQSVSYFMQTNGLLIDDEFCKFLKENNFLVGLSFDGTAEINDCFRVDYKNCGTAERVLKAEKLLKKHNVDFNTLTVVTKKNVSKGKEIYEFLKENGSGYMQFIPCIETDEKGNVREFCMTAEEYGKFLCETFDLWYNGGKPDTYVRFFEETLISYASYKSVNCSQLPSCIAAPVIEYDGSMYPCDFFVQKNMYLGNINDKNFSEISQGEVFNIFKYAKWQNVDDECKKCRWKGLCFGDCCKNRINGEKKSYFCEGYKMFYEYSAEKFLQLKRKIFESRPDLKKFENSLERNDVCPCGSGDKYKNCCMKTKRL